MKKNRTWICFRHPTPHSHIRNEQLVEQRRRRHESGIQVAKSLGIDIHDYYRLETKEKSPLRRGRRWRQHVLQLCEHWSCEPEDLFPDAASEHHSRLPGTGDVLMSAWSTRAADSRCYEDLLLREPGNKAMQRMSRKLSRKTLNTLLLYTLGGLQTKELAKKRGVTEQAILSRLKDALGLVVSYTMHRSRYHVKLTDILGEACGWKRKR